MFLNYLWPPIWYDADSGGEGGSADSNPDNTTGDHNNAGGSNANGGGESTRTFKQSELDALFAQRAKQAKESGISDLLKELGIDNLDGLKTTIKTAKEAADAQLSELEKAQKAAQTAQAERDAAKDEADKVRATAAEALLKAAVISAGGEFNDPNDLWLYLDRSKLEAQSDGSYKGLKEEIERVKKDKPYLLKSQVPPSSGTPSRQRRAAGGQQQTNGQQGQQQQEPARPVIRI